MNRQIYSQAIKEIAQEIKEGKGDLSKSIDNYIKGIMSRGELHKRGGLSNDKVKALLLSVFNSTKDDKVEAILSSTILEEVFYIKCYNKLKELIEEGVSYEELYNEAKDEPLLFEIFKELVGE
jgi:hypothetical protein